MMRKNITKLIRPNLKYAEVIWSPHKKKACVEIRNNTENSNIQGKKFHIN